MPNKDKGFDLPLGDDGDDFPDFDMSAFNPPSPETLGVLNRVLNNLKDISTQNYKHTVDSSGRVYTFTEYGYSRRGDDTIFSFIANIPDSEWPSDLYEELEEQEAPFATYAVAYSSPKITLTYDKYYGHNDMLLIDDKEVAHGIEVEQSEVDPTATALSGYAIQASLEFAGTPLNKEYVASIPKRNQAAQLGVDKLTEGSVQRLIKVIEDELQIAQNE